MNEQNRPVDVDTLARQAAAGLRQSVHEAELGARAPRPAGGRRIVALAVAVVLLVGGLVVLTRSGGGPDEDGGIASTGAATPLAPTALPDGLAFTGAFEGPIDSAGEVLPDFTVYTGADGSDATLIGLAATGEPEAAGPGVETVVQDGREYIIEPQAGGEVVLWSDEASGRVPTLIGRGLTRDELLNAAFATTVDDDGLITVAPEALPADTSWRATVPHGVASPMASAMATLDGSGGIGYADPKQTRTLEVAFAIAQDGWLESSEALMHEARPLEVRGRPAFGGGLHEGAAGATLTWVEADGTFVRLTGYDLSLDDLTEVAESLEPLTPEEWRAMLDQSDEDGGGSGDTGSASSGSGTETVTTFQGRGQAIESTDEPILLFEPTGDSRDVAFVSIAGQPGTAFEVHANQMPSIQSREFEGRWIYGVVPDDTERLVLRFAGGETEVTTFQNIAGGDLFSAWAFIVEAPGDQRDYELAAYGEDGSVTTFGS